MSIFKELLAIKSFREGQAEAQMRTQRAAALEAVQQTEAARDLLARLMDEGQREEAAMYARLCAQVVKLRDIEDVRGEVAQLRMREDQQEQNVERAIENQTEQDAKLEVARGKHKEAARQKSKFVDLASNHASEVMREAERKEDLEMEEVASIKRDRADWDEYAEEEQA